MSIVARGTSRWIVRAAACAALGVALAPAAAVAQARIDRVHRLNGVDSGQITAVTPLGVTISKSGVESTIPVEDIESVYIGGEPDDLNSVRSALQAGRLDDAFGDFNKAIQLDTTDPRAYHNRGLIYQARRQHDKAIDDFSKAISLSPSSAEPYNGRGISYAAQGDDDNAFSDFNTAINLDGKLAESWANQALIYERRGDMARAAKSYSHALKLDPNYAPAKAGLARTRGATNTAKPA